MSGNPIQILRGGRPKKGTSPNPDDWVCRPKRCSFFEQCKEAVKSLIKLPCQKEDVLATREYNDMSGNYSSGGGYRRMKKENRKHKCE